MLTTVTTPEIRELGLELKRLHAVPVKDPREEKLEGELEIVLAQKMARLAAVREAMLQHPRSLHPSDVERHPGLIT